MLALSLNIRLMNLWQFASVSYHDWLENFDQDQEFITAEVGILQQFHPFLCVDEIDNFLGTGMQCMVGYLSVIFHLCCGTQASSWLYSTVSSWGSSMNWSSLQPSSAVEEPNTAVPALDKKTQQQQEEGPHLMQSDEITQDLLCMWVLDSAARHFSVI